MKNFIISTMPFSDLLDISAAGFIGAVLFWFVFVILGALFPEHLGFPMMKGSEEIAMEASSLFYGIIAIPMGAGVGVLVGLKLMNYDFRPVRLLLAVTLLYTFGLVLRDFFDIFTFIFYAVICSLLLSTVSSIGQKN